MKCTAVDIDEKDDEVQATEKDAFQELNLATASLNENPSEVIFSFLFVKKKLFYFVHIGVKWIMFQQANAINSMVCFFLLVIFLL